MKVRCRVVCCGLSMQVKRCAPAGSTVEVCVTLSIGEKQCLQAGVAGGVQRIVGSCPLSRRCVPSVLQHLPHACSASALHAWWQ